MEYKKILIGLNTYSSDWLQSIKKIKQPNIILFDFSLPELDKIIDSNEIYYILPLSELDYQILKKKIDFDKYKILYPTENIFNLLNNKLNFTKFMMNKFSNYIPEVYYLENIKINDPIYPMISKPIFSTNGANMFIINNNNKLEKCKNKMIIQKYIEFDFEYSAHFLCIDGHIKNWKVIKQLYPKYYIKKNNFTTYIDIKDFPINLFENITTELDYTGGGCIDFKYNEETKEIYIFEFNPRFGGSAFTENFIYELLCIK